MGMPGLAHAMWTHGTSMQIEYVHRAGHGVYVESKSGQENWVHFAIPTPVIVTGNRLRVGSVLVDFMTGSADAFEKHVHVYDGDTKLRNRASRQLLVE